MSEGMRLTEDPLTKLDNSFFLEPPATAAGSATLREGTRTLLAAKLDRLLPIYLKEEWVGSAAQFDLIQIAETGILRFA